jgi:hypothetical protein
MAGEPISLRQRLPISLPLPSDLAALPRRIAGKGGLNVYLRQADVGSLQLVDRGTKLQQVVRCRPLQNGECRQGRQTLALGNFAPATLVDEYVDDCEFLCERKGVRFAGA